MISGVFPDLVNERAFIDRIVVNVSGKTRSEVSGELKKIRDIGIAGPHSPYARLWQGMCISTDNPVGWKYGKYLMTRWRQKLAPYQLSVRSHASPVTCGEVDLILAAMTTQMRASVGLVELTFDTEGFRYEDARRDLFTTSRLIQEFESPSRRRTLLVGSPRSAWQLRIYEKTGRILRFEFILRPDFLRTHDIRRPHDLLKLKVADLWRFAWWLELLQHAALAKFPQLDNEYQLQAAIEGMRMSTRETERWLRRENRICTGGLLKRSAIETTLRRMQGRLIW